MRYEWLPYVSWVLILKLSNHILKGNISKHFITNWEKKKKVTVANNSSPQLVSAIFQFKPGVKHTLANWN